MPIGRPVSYLIRVFLIFFIAFSAMSGAIDISAASVGMHAESTVEHTYVARSWLETRVRPTDFCLTSGTKFDKAMTEDPYTFRSISAPPEDGLIVDTDGLLASLPALPELKAFRKGPLCCEFDGRPR